MENMNEIRHHVRAIEQTRKITNAMYLVSTARMRKYMVHINYNRKYFKRVRLTVQDILNKSKDIQHPYLDVRGDKSAVFIVIAGDKGMCGAYNVNVLEFALKKIQERAERYVITVGTVASAYFRRKGIEPDIEVLDIAQDPSLFNARKLTEDILQIYDQNLTDEVFVIYTAFFSTARQEPKEIRLLPLNLRDFEYLDTADDTSDILYEPSPQEAFTMLVPQYCIGIIFGALVQSYASEQSARMTAMESATRNADEILQKLKVRFNRARQAAITQEISEIAGAAQVLRAEEAGE